MNKDYKLTIPKAILPSVQGAQNEPEEKYVLPLDGKWIPAEDPILLGKNFRTLTNMRYDKLRPVSIEGMEKINSSTMNATYFNPRSAFHFYKAQPVESHVLVQSFNSGLSASVVLDNPTSIPVAGGFGAAPVWTDTSGSGQGMFSNSPDGSVAYCNGVDSCIWAGNEGRCAAFLNIGATDDVVYDFTDAVTNLKQDTGDIATLVAVSHVVTLNIGATRPLSKINLYMLSGYVNATASTVAVSYDNGSGWTSVSSLVDGTSNGTVTLNKTGTISFDSTVAVAKPRYVNGRYLYFYQLVFSYVDAGTAVYYCTVSSPMQPIIDIWDGQYRQLVSCYSVIYSVATDFTLNVRKGKDDLTYDAADPDTFIYADLSPSGSVGGITLEVGFNEQVTALQFEIPPSFGNRQTADIVIDYWDGSAYVNVGTVVDGTQVTVIGPATLNRTGVVSWAYSDPSLQHRKSINGGESLFFYRISSSAPLFQGSGIANRIYYIAGIPVVTKKSGYSFSMLAADRLMLGCDNYGKKNLLAISAEGQPDVWNGADSFEIKFGDDKALTCGASIFAQYISNIYNAALVFKDSETWSLVWNSTPTGMTWTRFLLSPTVGCPAPLTMKAVSVSAEPGMQQTKTIVIWRAHNGIYVSNGQAPYDVSDDISNVFDQSKSLHVNLAMIRNESGFIDEDKMEYHWIWYSGSNTTPDKEYVLDLKQWKWYDIDRTSGKRLIVGVNVTSAIGNKYAYGFLSSGIYMERLEYGTSFDGEAIVSTCEMGALTMIQNDVLSQTEVTRANLIAASKTADTSITMTYTGDESLSGINFVLSDSSGKRLANVMQDIFSNPAVFHSIKLSKNTSNETIGFEPIAIALYFQKVRDKYH
jgi:hypothetical protein